MNIGIDGNEANIENRVGVNQYAYEIISNIYKLQDAKNQNLKIIVYLKENPRNDLPKERDNFEYRVLPGGGMWIVKTLTPYLLKNLDNLDIFFAPSHYVPPISRVPLVCAIMDLGYLNYSGQFRKYDYWQLRLWSAWSMFISKKVIAISEATRSDIVKNYPFASKKIKVTLLAGDDSIKNSKPNLTDIKRIKNTYNISKNYILFLGTLKPSKNIEGLLRAWSKIYSKYPDYSLVIAGKKGWLYDSIFKEALKLGIKNNVVFTGFVKDEDKPALMAGAKVFTLPSFWEGFGIDIVNAYSLGVPVVTSRSGSIPEVAGKVGVYIDPNDATDIARGISKVLTLGDKDYNKLSGDCVAWSKRYSWEKTARETLRILKEK